MKPVRIICAVVAIALVAVGFIMVINAGNAKRSIAHEQAEDVDLAIYRSQYQECVNGIADTRDLVRRQGDPYLLSGMIISRYEDLMDVVQERIDGVNATYEARFAAERGKTVWGVILMILGALMGGLWILVLPKMKRQGDSVA